MKHLLLAILLAGCSRVPPWLPAAQTRTVSEIRRLDAAYPLTWTRCACRGECAPDGYEWAIVSDGPGATAGLCSCVGRP